MKSLFLALAAFIALIPGSAFAHRGEHHPVEQQVVHDAAAQASNAAHAVVLPCPGGAGGKCCCEKLDICSLGGKPPVIASSWRIVPTLFGEWLVLAEPAAAHSSLALTVPLPRGPPQRS